MRELDHESDSMDDISVNSDDNLRIDISVSYGEIEVERYFRFTIGYEPNWGYKEISERDLTSNEKSLVAAKIEELKSYVGNSQEEYEQEIRERNREYFAAIGARSFRL